MIYVMYTKWTKHLLNSSPFSAVPLQHLNYLLAHLSWGHVEIQFVNLIAHGALSYYEAVVNFKWKMADGAMIWQLSASVFVSVWTLEGLFYENEDGLGLEERPVRFPYENLVIIYFGLFLAFS